MSRTVTADLLLDCANGLGESALGDTRRQLVRWVDVPAGELHSLDLVSGWKRHLRLGHAVERSS
jgi:sugar lactone lactonase YvrE